MDNKPLTHLLKLTFLAFILCCIFVLFAYSWIDRPVVFWVQSHHISSSPYLRWFPHIADVLAALPLLLFPTLAIRFAYKKWGPIDQVLFASVLSISLSYFLRGTLQYIFGRYWPDTWLFDNLSLLRNNAYGFNWFHNFYGSFPSGHTAVTVATMTVLWMAYPMWRWLYVLLILLVAIGLIGMNYHFVSDVIAGGFLGWFTAFFITKILHQYKSS